MATPTSPHNALLPSHLLYKMVLKYSFELFLFIIYLRENQATFWRYQSNIHIAVNTFSSSLLEFDGAAISKLGIYFGSTVQALGSCRRNSVPWSVIFVQVDKQFLMATNIIVPLELQQRCKCNPEEHCILLYIT